ncbi:hypothetical protein, partial [uncultured Nostoc sp.]|uniref:hypothetical protein n=1 Tax=uncultured Nostoc sp. TaxID=340711 RepID=UPI0035C96C45
FTSIKDSLTEFKDSFTSIKDSLTSIKVISDEKNTYVDEFRLLDETLRVACFPAGVRSTLDHSVGLSRSQSLTGNA